MNPESTVSRIEYLECPTCYNIPTRNEIEEHFGNGEIKARIVSNNPVTRILTTISCATINPHCKDGSGYWYLKDMADVDKFLGQYDVSDKIRIVHKRNSNI